MDAKIKLDGLNLNHQIETYLPCHQNNYLNSINEVSRTYRNCILSIKTFNIYKEGQ
jgi:hypothetical protein